MVPLALDPTPETARRVSETPPPFYALLTHIAIPMLGHVLEGAIASRQRLAVVLEALRLEQARRKTGELPPPRREIDGLKIDVKETELCAGVRGPEMALAGTRAQLPHAE